MTHEAQLGPGREFDLIRRVRARWGSLAVGLGDDAALLDVPRGEHLVASTDAAVEGVHFRRDWIGHDEIGSRAVTAALSDLAAMAALPLGLLISLEVPNLDDAQIDALADGIGAAAQAAGVTIRGGNTARSDRLAITTTVMGSVFAPLARTGARAGEAVYITGALGGPSMAIRDFRAGRPPNPAARQRFVHPVARLREARWLSAHGASAAIDISDGLGGDAAHLAAASGCTLELDLDRVPLMAGASPEDVWGGEEYELLVTAAGDLDAEALHRTLGTRLTRIGTVAAGNGSAVFTRAGRRVASPGGYDHLSR